MNANTLRFIRTLSLNDKKPLTQKTAKLFEEGGELSKNVLGYDSVCGSTHRMVTKENILEELADVFLVNMSMVYDLGFTDAEFESKVIEKSQIWNGIQVKEDRSLAQGDDMPYELHITINALDGIDVDQFKSVCKDRSIRSLK